MTDQILDALAPILVQTLATVLLGVLAWAGVALRSYLSAGTVERLGRILTQAMERGLALAAEEGQVDLEGRAVAYVQRMNTETVRKLGASTADLRKRAEAQAAQMRAPVPGPMPLAS